MSLWEVIGYFIWIYFLFTFIGILLGLVLDVFRDPALNGWAKAAWVIFLVILPIIGSIVYIVARGGTMSERQFEYARKSRAQTEDYIRSAASNSPADEIAKAKALLDSGSITTAEFEGMKARALAGTTARVA